MIFVALGTQKFQFNRLLKAMDELIEKGLIYESVFAQVGYSTYKPVNFSSAKMLSQEQFHSMITECSLLVTHGGVGTIMNGLKYEKKIIVCPRLKYYNEHIDDHQLDIAKKYEQLEYVISCYDIANLGECIIRAKSFTSKYKKNKSNNNILNLINKFIGNH